MFRIVRFNLTIRNSGLPQDPVLRNRLRPCAGRGWRACPRLGARRPQNDHRPSLTNGASEAEALDHAQDALVVAVGTAGRSARHEDRSDGLGRRGASADFQSLTNSAVGREQCAAGFATAAAQRDRPARRRHLLSLSRGPRLRRPSGGLLNSPAVPAGKFDSGGGPLTAICGRRGGVGRPVLRGRCSFDTRHS